MLERVWTLESRSELGSEWVRGGCRGEYCRFECTDIGAISVNGVRDGWIVNCAGKTIAALVGGTDGIYALSTAGLPGNKAIVNVGPPLSCRPFGSSKGSSGEANVPVWSLGCVKPVLLSANRMRLKPKLIKKPEGAPSMIVLLTIMFAPGRLSTDS